MNKKNTKRKDFLIEIGTQELPQKNLKILGESFKKNIKNQLKINQIEYKSIKWYATSRRLALKINKLYFQKKNKNIKNTEKILINIINLGINKLPINYPLYFQDQKIKFVRPITNILILLNNKVIKGNILGININRFIYGHKFIGKKKIFIKSIHQYPEILYKEGMVIASFKKRKNIILEEINKIANNLNCTVKISNYMLEEITSLVEWPVVLNGKFNDIFLKIPKEILLHIIEKKQKYFSTYNSKNKLTNNFIFVINTNTKEKKNIIHWNEKILNSHLKEIDFFYQLDQKKKLEKNLPKLKKVLFHQSIGTMYDKSLRLKYLSGWIASKIGANISDSERSGLLSKCDLTTHMVSEFRELQGIIGMYYAVRDKEKKEIAMAIRNQYFLNIKNRKNDLIKVSHSLFLAEKTDNLVGIFKTKEHHNNSNDPFGLKRTTNEIIKTIIQYKYNINLTDLIQKNIKLYKKLKIIKSTENIKKYILKRLIKIYENLQYNKKIIMSVINNSEIIPTEIDNRIKSISYYYKSKKLNDLTEIYKRVSNILKKSKDELNEKFSFELLKKKEEIILTNHLFKIKKKIKELLIKNKYQDAIMVLFSLKKKIDPFFEKVFILSKNKKTRTNRLIILKEIKSILLKIADISLLN